MHTGTRIHRRFAISTSPRPSAIQTATLLGPTTTTKEVTVKLVDRVGCSATLKSIFVIPAIALPLGGCSLAFVGGPSPQQSAAGRSCTTSYTAPTLDLLGVPATFLLGFGFGGFERSLEAVGPDDDETFGNLEKASLAASGVLLASGVYGLVQVGRCRGSRQRNDSAFAPRARLLSSFDTSKRGDVWDDPPERSLLILGLPREAQVSRVSGRERLEDGDPQ